jgi:hypothetical protein
VGNKIYKITELFDRVVQLKNWGVTYWAERNGPAVVWIIRELKKLVKKPVFVTGQLSGQPVAYSFRPNK